MTANGEPNLDPDYRLVEVKRWSEAAPLAVRTQLNTYLNHLQGAGLRVEFEDRLNGIGWVVSYFDNDGKQWFAWAPLDSDNEGPGGFHYPAGMRYVGEVYFETEDKTPAPVKNRWNSHKTMADRDYTYLRWYTTYVVIEYLLNRNPYEIPRVPVPCC